jgi:hypothetical protein
MWKRSLLLWASCVFLFAVALSIVFSPTKPNQMMISKEGYGKLQLGVTRQEVEKTLGGSPGDYGPGKGEILDYGIFTVASDSIRSNPKAKNWLAGSYAITVCFDDQDRVQALMGTNGVYRPYDSVIEMCCQRLHLKQKKPYPPGSLKALFNQ